MESKIGYALKKCKSVFIMIAILWAILSIVLIVPMSIQWVDEIEKNNSPYIKLLEADLTNIGGNLLKVCHKEYIGTFLKADFMFLLILLGFGIIGIIKTLPKHDYRDIEHGSSDWASGEQYSILSKNKGIILAEKHYLPVDKRGNVNVLVVGRFRFW